MNNWGGKREGAGRKKEVAYTSKTQGIYCSSPELIHLKNYLAYRRCMMNDPLNLNGTDGGEFWIKHSTFLAWMGGRMENEDWEDFRQHLEPGTVEKLEKAYEKRMKKLEKARAK
ncbi:hypothetical protein [Selenomonas ruminantium]|uniref:Uncharacterized protein n=1 Tax=Selenomonas ruminantium TaxID=971 RepID=A0A1I0YD88_SELRU|nr:hypothetical protein [Selenomonas ruminantium]SFB10348.1 hypothetical protein SAMN05216587_11159 [Selenomonas ruminantium]